MNWLAILISSLRDFTRCDSSLTRAEGTLHDATASLHAAAPPYTPEGPYTTRSVLTRGNAALHARRALHGTTCLISPLRPFYEFF